MVRVRVSAAALIAALATNFAAASDWSWHDTLSPHFAVRHETTFMPGGFTMSLERLHGRLRMDLGMFSPWMSRERLKLYLYKNRESYTAGEFSPTPWSNGISIYEKRLVAVYDKPQRDKLLSVIAHETTHLLFESYFGEAGRQPPAWLNEGLAMVEEAEAEHPERSGWFANMVHLPQQGFMPLRELVTISPTTDLHDNKPRIERWYVQSYSLTYFLVRLHTRLQFKSFCANLRDGADPQQALWLSYRYKGFKSLQKAWLEWLNDPSLRRKASL